MRIVSFLFFLFCLIGISFRTYADSPLTSVDLWTVNSKDLNVKHALKSKKMDPQNISYLLNEDNPLEIRIAVVNAIGWKFKSSPQNSKKLLSAILKKYKMHSIDQLKQRKYASILCIYSYSLALENYFDVVKAFELTQAASMLSQDEPMIDYVARLIESQYNFNNKDFCGVYRVFRDSEKQTYYPSSKGKLILDLTLDYVRSYSKYCSINN